ncbi:hypothetical protein BOTBODRAFT_156073 [Botryobasidium botryosum FD-172 SS1]|uniref:UvrD-like helicase ATP-binding domain-containing protein n=1 Tax=Botryobasidium botryosum (strain FD-172 SS1) TaxID=930990 RepID=A0A067MRM4_BOTB1|nr:hypothetical protein BOTBODRAFT_156073 [Botryobasidium botryosum FD-172 SS1]
MTSVIRIFANQRPVATCHSIFIPLISTILSAYDHRAESMAHTGFDLRAFDAVRLQNEESLHAALLSMELFLRKIGDYHAVADELISDVLSTPRLLPFLYSASLSTSMSLANVITKSIHSSTRFEATAASGVIRALREFYIVLPPLPALRFLDDYNRAIPSLLAALKALDNIILGPAPGDEVASPAPQSPKKERRQSRRQSRSEYVSRSDAQTRQEKVFGDIGHDIPHTVEAAQQLRDRVVEKVENTLNAYLSQLEDKDVFALAKQMYLGNSESDRVAQVQPPSAPLQPIVESKWAEKQSANTTANTISPGATADTFATPAAPCSTASLSFPSIKPISASRFFGPNPKFGKWAVHLSGRATTDIKEYHHKSPSVFHSINEKIRELSMGYFSGANLKVLEGGVPGVRIFEAKVTGDLRLVYQVDLAANMEAKVDIQVIKVYGVYTHNQLNDRLWAAVAHHTAGKGKVYRKMCALRNFSEDTNGGGKRHQQVISPVVFPHDPDGGSRMVERAIEEYAGLDEGQRLEMQKLLVTGKFIPYSSSVVKSIIKNIELPYMYYLAPREQEVVSYPGSCFVLGRSGTGKTTTLLFKMFFREIQALESGGSGSERERQLFVTQSPRLVRDVRERFNKMMEAYNLGKEVPEDDAPGDVAGGRRDGVPESADVGGGGGGESKPLAELDPQNEQIASEGLPARFSELRDHHFPLFVSFTKLCLMLQADIQAHSQKVKGSAQNDSPGHQHAQGDAADRSYDFSNTLTFDDFASRFWPHFNQLLIKNLDPTLVWNEFMGVIRGSVDAIKTKKGYLSRDAYLQLGERTHPMLTSSRDRVYSIFEAYLKKKLPFGARDAAERTHAILEELKLFREEKRDLLPLHKEEETSLLSDENKVDYLYVDEAQDLLLVDTVLLRSLCKNPNGLCWVGDTAQTVAKGSSFRFEDITATMFNLELAQPLVVMRKRPPVRPHLLQLPVNYRSHTGIVNPAASVVDIICKLFPNSIDQLERESGLLSGPKIKFICPTEGDRVSLDDFLSTRGSNQCIIVRSCSEEDKKAGVHKLTPEEVKGLEYDDVLLYGFFGDSPADLTTWRRTLSKELVPCTTTREAILCIELKALYVSLTRGRARCWILDSSPKAQPMKRFWESREEVEVLSASGLHLGNADPTMSSYEALKADWIATSPSSPEEWVKEGEKLFSKELFSRAKTCFERAGQFEKATISSAYATYAQAKKDFGFNRLAHSNRKTQAFKDAGLQLFNCTRMHNITCIDKQRCFQLAGGCFDVAGEWLLAGESFFEAGSYTPSVEHYLQAGLYDKCVQIIKAHRIEIESSVACYVLDQCKRHYLKNFDFKKAQYLFDTRRLMVDYLKHEAPTLDYIRLKCLVDFLGWYEEAADLHISKMAHVEAIPLLLRSRSTGPKAVSCLFDGLWNSLPLGTSPNNGFRSLLSLASSIDLDSLDPQQMKKRHIELKVFQAIDQAKAFDMLAQLIPLGQLAQPRHIGFFPSSINLEPFAILCLDHALMKVDLETNLTVASAMQTLRLHELYASTLAKIALDPGVCQNPEAQRLFGFTLHKESDVSFHNPCFVSSTSSLSKESFLKIGPNSSRSLPYGNVTSEASLRTAVQDFIAVRIYPKVLGIQEILLGRRDWGRLCSVCSIAEIEEDAKRVEGREFSEACQIHEHQIRVLLSLGGLNCPLDLTGRYAEVRRDLLQKIFDAHLPTCSTPDHVTWSKHHTYLSRTYGSGIRGWVRGRIPLFSSRVLSVVQLNEALKAGILIHIYDFERASNFPRPSLYQAEDSRSIRGEPVDTSLTRQLLRCLLSPKPDRVASLQNGASFLERIIEGRVAVDYRALVAFAELFTKLLLASKELHCLTLPESWVGEILYHHSPVSSDEIRRLDKKLEKMALSLGALLRHICGCPESPACNACANQSLTTRGRSALEFRMCRLLILLYENYPGKPVGESAHGILASLVDSGSIFPNLTSRNFTISGVNLCLAMRLWKPFSGIDALIQIHEGLLPPTKNPLKGKIVPIQRCRHDANPGSRYPRCEPPAQGPATLQGQTWDRSAPFSYPRYPSCSHVEPSEEAEDSEPPNQQPSETPLAAPEYTKAEVAILCRFVSWSRYRRFRFVEGALNSPIRLHFLNCLSQAEALRSRDFGGSEISKPTRDDAHGGVGRLDADAGPHGDGPSDPIQPQTGQAGEACVDDAGALAEPSTDPAEDSGARKAESAPVPSFTKTDAVQDGSSKVGEASKAVAPGGVAPRHISYAKLFLGPLPHMLVHLDSLRVWCLRSILGAAASLDGSQASNTSLLTTLKRLYKDIVVMIYKLKASSSCHETRSVQGLAEAFLEVEKMTKALGDITGEMAYNKENLMFALKWI